MIAMERKKQKYKSYIFANTLVVTIMYSLNAFINVIHVFLLLISNFIQLKVNNSQIFFCKLKCTS